MIGTIGVGPTQHTLHVLSTMASKSCYDIIRFQNHITCGLATGAQLVVFGC